MRIIVWGINYAPELTGIGPCNVALCEYLVSQGHQVEMLTTFAYYPAWKKAPEDTGRLYRTDRINEVPVRRCWHYVPARVTTLKRIFHELSFVATSFLRFLSLSRAEVVVVVSPPLLLGFAAWLGSLIKGSRFIFHVQDLQPDAAVGLGMIRPGPITRVLYALERFAYRKAARVCGISQGMLRAFTEKQVPPEKQVYFPNGIRLEQVREIQPGEFRHRHGYAPGDFLAVYSGNIGAKQGLATLVQAAARLGDSRVKIVLCGDGAYREQLLALVQAQPHPSPVTFLPLLAETEYRQMLADADLCLITQAPGTGRFFFPSKLLPALAQSKPILSVADAESELARAVAESGCGINVLTDQPDALAAKLEEIANDSNGLEEMGRNGRAYVSQFEMGKVLRDFEQVLGEVRP